MYLKVFFLLSKIKLHTKFKIFARKKLSFVIKKFGSGSIFGVFASVTSILIRKDGEYVKMKKNAYEYFRPVDLKAHFSIMLML